MFHLITTYYKTSEIEREEENLKCLRENINNPLIACIHLFLQGNDYPEIEDTSKKVKYVNFEKRPFFSDLFAFANSLEKDIVKIVSNSDIYFDDTLNYSLDVLKEVDVLALTRWDELGNGNLEFYNNYKSQDVWIFNRKIEASIGQYHIGRHGCDNKLIYEFQKYKYTVVNPSLSIKVIHVHKSALRSYFDDHNYEYVKPPYGYLLPIYLSKEDLKSEVLKYKYYSSRYSYFRALRRNKLPGLNVGKIRRFVALIIEKIYARMIK